MSGGVSSKGSVPSDYEFILKPLSAECHVVMDQSSDIVLDTPKFLIEVLQQELLLAFSQNQFHNVMDLIESFELMAVNQQYQCEWGQLHGGNMRTQQFVRRKLDVGLGVA